MDTTASVEDAPLQRHEASERELLARNVIIARARGQLSQSALAQAAGVSRATISNLERAFGSTSLETICRVAAAFEIRVCDLFTAPASVETGDDDLEALAARAREGAVNAHDLLAALDEAESDIGAELQRYSRAGRPAARRTAVSLPAAENAHA